MCTKSFKPDILDDDFSIRKAVEFYKKETGLSKRQICRLIMKCGINHLELNEAANNSSQYSSELFPLRGD